MSAVNKNLGTRLRELRGDRTVYQIYKASGIDRTQLARYEDGRLPEPRVLKQLAEFYGIPYFELRALAFEDMFPTGSEDRELLKQWLYQS